MGLPFKPLMLRCLLTCLPALLACSPALDWREVSAPEAGLDAMFPCKPQRLSAAESGLLQCEAGGLRFVLAWQRADAPQALQMGLASAAGEAASRAGARLESLPGARLPVGAFDWPGSGRFRLYGGTQPVQLLVWARGLTRYRALVLGARADEVSGLFFDGLRSRT